MNDRELIIARDFAAPRDLVWQAWTNCERLSRWWGPKGFTTPHCKIDLRVGGTSHSCMRSPEGPPAGGGHGNVSGRLERIVRQAR